MPAFDEGAFVLDYKTPPGASLEETNRVLLHIEEMLKDTPEVESFSRRTGAQLGLSGVTEPNTGDFAVKMKADRTRATEEVTADLREEIEKSEPTVEVEFIGILSDLIGDLASSPEPVEIKIFSDDKKALEAKAAEVEDSIKKVAGVVDTFDGVVVSGAAITFKINPQSAAQFGVNATDVADAVETAMSGNAASAILQQGKLITVRVDVSARSEKFARCAERFADSLFEQRRTISSRSSGDNRIRQRTDRNCPRRLAPIDFRDGQNRRQRSRHDD